MPKTIRLALYILAILVAGSLAAAENEKENPKTDAQFLVAPPDPIRIATQHRLKSGGVDIAYTAAAEEIYLKDDEDKYTASFFTLSYTKDGTEHPEDRPLTFVFNGGPGSASLWLHMGMVGPRIIDIPSDASDPGSPPYHLRDNPWTLLRATDLVFVDPVGTGFSKALGEKKNEDFWGFDEDADSVAEFIRMFITMHNRWNSPKFIMGESYGGIRSALLVPMLQQQLNIPINGLILISPALNMGTLPFYVAGNDLVYATHLPAYAASAFYHHKLPDSWPDLQTLLAEVESYASTTYLQALFKGDALSQAEKQQVAEQLHRFTGLGTDYILRSNLRVYAVRFIKELMRNEGKSIGLLDGRYIQDELDDVAEMPDSDPFNAKTGPVYVSSFQSYLRSDFGVDLSRRYFASSDKANASWKRPPDGTGAFSGYVDTTAKMAQGTKDNEDMRVFAAAGYHDLTTSYFAMTYMLRHSGIDPEKLEIKDYEGGHMMYLYQPSLEKLSNDIIQFIERD